LESLSRRVVRDAPFNILRGKNIVPEVRSGYVTVLLPGDRSPSEMQELLAPGHCDIEQSTLVLNCPFKPRLSFDSGTRKQVPYAASADSGRRKPIPEQRRDKDDWPLHTLGLVHGHDTDCVGGGVLVILPTLRVGILSVVLQEVCK